MGATLVVLAAGMGSRYGGLKQLDRFGPQRKTIMDYSIQDAIGAGFDCIVFVIREEFESQFRAQTSSRYENEVDVRLVHQKMEVEGLLVNREKPWGTGHAVLCAEPATEQPFAVINADDFYGRKSFHLASQFLNQKASSDLYGMVGYILSNTLSPHGSVSRGICTVGSDNKLVTVREHTGIRSKGGVVLGDFEGKEVQLPPDSIVSMNLWMFHPSVFAPLREAFMAFARENTAHPKAEFYLPFFVDERLKSGATEVEVLTSPDRWYGVTFKEDRQRVNRALEKMHEEGVY
ncbi:MAG: nucleotidyltransferase [Saprospirales bacterium]|nr:MAG: nucleotidyltransferase [Saprospirales bacterium]